MIKYAVLLLNFTGILIYNAFFSPDVNLSVNAPKQAEPGQEFTVEVNIKKGSIAGFAQLKMELPGGFTAAPGEKGGADFKMSGTTVRFTWTSLPSQEEIKVSLKLTPPQGNTGKVTLSGKFSYLVDNNKTFADIPPIEIEIGKTETVSAPPPPDPQPTTTTTNTPPENNTPPPPDTTPTTTTNNTTPDPPPTGDQKSSAPPVNVTASRKLPGEVKAGEEFLVEVTINKGGLKGFARFQDVIPEGLTALAAESRGGSFSFLDQKVKIVWENVPSDETFTITYKLRPDASASGSLTIEGVFSYVENDEPKKIILTPSFVNVTRESSTNTVTTTTNTSQNNPNNTTTPPDTTNTNTTTTTTNNNTTTITTPDPPPTNTNVAYKVQICALRSTAPDNTYFQNRYGITENINWENHEGWTKLTVGKFNTYKGARDHRNGIRNKGVGDAFVTAYNSGTRITVQEALMITKQQWYQ
ncbi:MAG: hypothetical protein IT233_03285 [Bacteroidia bacterium]|nr:hypothetical protein [Bacteroidia bacterium]